MSANQLFNYSFSSAGKNKYFANEVDEYLKGIISDYEELLKKNAALEKKLKNIGPAIEEYTNKKNTVFSAIVRIESYLESVKAEAQEHSAEILRQASEEAETLLLTRKAEAEAYYFNVTHDADERLKKLERDFETLKTQSEVLQQQYISDTKEKAAEIIDNAKTKAAEIVAAAYDDAKTSRRQSEEVIEATTAELNRLKAEIAKYKNEIFNVVNIIKPAVDSISDDAEFDFVPTNVEVDTDKLAEKLPEFELNINYNDTAIPEMPSMIFEDVSSISSPEYYEDEQDGISMSDESIEKDEIDELLKFKSGIFSDDSEESPLNFSYQPDYDGFFDDDITTD